jgi:hypothetical protein
MLTIGSNWLSSEDERDEEVDDDDDQYREASV